MEHTHTYIRVRGKKNIYMCKDPDCKYYAEKNLLEGKKALCGLCAEPFILDRKQLLNKLPRCRDCKKGKIVAIDKNTDNILDDMMGRL